MSSHETFANPPRDEGAGHDDLQFGIELVMRGVGGGHRRRTNPRVKSEDEARQIAERIAAWLRDRYDLARKPAE